MNPNEEEDLSIFEQYKLYTKEKYEQLLKKYEITNYPLDEFVIIDGIRFKMLDDLKIYILENNIKINFDGKEDIFSEPYQYQNMSTNDIGHIKDWYWWKDKPREFIVE